MAMEQPPVRVIAFARNRDPASDRSRSGTPGPCWLSGWGWTGGRATGVEWRLVAAPAFHDHNEASASREAPRHCACPILQPPMQPMPHTCAALAHALLNASCTLLALRSTKRAPARLLPTVSTAGTLASIYTFALAYLVVLQCARTRRRNLCGASGLLREVERPGRRLRCHIRAKASQAVARLLRPERALQPRHRCCCHACQHRLLRRQRRQTGRNTRFCSRAAFAAPSMIGLVRPPASGPPYLRVCLATSAQTVDGSVRQGVGEARELHVPSLRAEDHKHYD
jgi:hypothetical protein